MRTGRRTRSRIGWRRTPTGTDGAAAAECAEEAVIERGDQHFTPASMDVQLVPQTFCEERKWASVTVGFHFDIDAHCRR